MKAEAESEFCCERKTANLSLSFVKYHYHLKPVWTQSLTAERCRNITYISSFQKIKMGLIKARESGPPPSLTCIFHLCTPHLYPTKQKGCNLCLPQMAPTCALSTHAHELILLSKSSRAERKAVDSSSQYSF